VESTDLLERAVCYQVSLGQIGTQRQVDSKKVSIRSVDAKEQENGDPDKSMLRLTKEIIKCPELDAIRKLDGAIRDYVSKRTLSVPGHFRRGVYLLPVPKVVEVDQRMEQLRTERDVLIESFLAVYKVETEKARAKLGSLFDEKDYPPVDQVCDAFYFRTCYIDMGTPGTLKDQSSDIWKREREKAEKEWATAAEHIQATMRQSLLDLVQHMRERLTGDSDGKPKMFRDTLVTNMREFLEWFEPRNITDDSEMAKVVEQCRKVLGSADAQTLRDTPTVRAKVATGMAQVEAELDKLVADKPKRRTLAVD